MTVNFNTQQKIAISEYRKANNLGYVISDDQVVKEMIKSGKLPSCFGSLGNVSSTSSKQNNQSVFSQNISSKPSAQANPKRGGGSR